MEADHRNPTRNTGVVGGGSCGKTSFAIRYYLNIPWTCAFIFDPDGRLSQRLRVKWCGTARECDEALASGVVCVNPNRLFSPARTVEAFDWFCDWFMARIKTAPGRKILLAEEAWMTSRNGNFSESFAAVIKTARFWHGEYMGITHRPQNFPLEVRELMTEWIVFRLTQDSSIKAISSVWSGVEKANALPPFHYLAYDVPRGIERAYQLPAL